MDNPKKDLTSLIDELAELYGVVPEYWDIFGKKHIASSETKKAILATAGFRVDAEEEITAAIKRLRDEPWNMFVEPVHVTSLQEHSPLTIPLYIPIGEGDEKKLSISWSLEDEQGKVEHFSMQGEDISIADQRMVDDRRAIRTDLPCIPHNSPHYPIGYYSLHVVCKHPDPIFPGGQNFEAKSAKVIIAPDSCYIPERLEQGKVWGLATNLYAVRSTHNWGIGDLTDLKEMIGWIASLGGSFVGVNPLHSIPNTMPFGISPYSPISRLYKNFIYLDLEKVPECSESPNAQAIMHSESSRDELHNLKKQDLVDYERVAFVKREILRFAFEPFYKSFIGAGSPRIEAFKRYVAEEGGFLDGYATFMALAEYFAAEDANRNDPYTWKAWPEEYQDPMSGAVREFKSRNEKEILFFKYLQWLIDEQLEECFEEVKRSGIAVGIYHDLAIGSVSGGSDVWNYQDIIAKDMDSGAPPDDFNPNGQNWGFPPLIPSKLKETGYELFIQTIRKNVKYCGALRIDHALGLFRRFWIPQGMSAKEGAYLKYPTEDLFRIIALESVRNNTVIVAEDLGTIGENVRETLQKYRMLSYRLLYFERNYPDPSFVPPEKYPEIALCAITTHDLPTIYGFWSGHDIETKKELGAYAVDTEWKKAREERVRDKKLLLEALRSEGIAEDISLSGEMTPELCQHLYEYLARTPCMFLAVSLDDILGKLNQQNMPGIMDDYPNWRQKTDITLEQMTKDKRFADLAEMLKKNGRQPLV